VMKKTLAVALLSLSSVALADTGFYLGGGFGRTSYEVDGAALQAENASLGLTNTTSVDDTDSGVKIVAGFQFNENLAMEVGFVDLGEAKITSTVTAPGQATDVLRAEASAVFFDMVGTAPLNRDFALIGRVGLASTRLEVSESCSGVLVCVGSDEEQDVNLKFGFGGQISFSRNVALRAEWERYMDVGEGNTPAGKPDVDMLSVSLKMSF